MNAHNRVMVVDDERRVRQSWSRFLSERGFDVSTAPDSNTAMRDLEAHPADVVVSDLRMPGPDGLELLAWVRDNQPDTRFILLTGYGNQQVKERAAELGAYEYLNKPIAPDTLANIVTAASHLGFIPTAMPAVGPFMDEISDPDLELLLPVEEVVRPEVPEATAEAAPESTEEEALEPAEAPEKKSAVRSTAEIAFGLVVAPILGLLFVILLPVLGLGALAWVLFESLRDRMNPPPPGGDGPDADPTPRKHRAPELPDFLAMRLGTRDMKPPPTQFN